MSYLRYLCLFGYSGVQHILYCVFALVYLRLVYPMLSVSLECQFLVAPSVFSDVNFWLHLRYSLTIISKYTRLLKYCLFVEKMTVRTG